MRQRAAFSLRTAPTWDKRRSDDGRCPFSQVASSYPVGTGVMFSNTPQVLKISQDHRDIAATHECHELGHVGTVLVEIC